MANKDWGTTFNDEKPVYVILFTSRNKDNKHLEGFKERRESFLTNKSKEDLSERFKAFVNDGVEGEMSRFYISINSRNKERLYKKVLHFLIDNPTFNICSLPSKIAGLAAEHDCSDSKRWMFDFDMLNESLANDFCSDIKEIDNSVETEIHRTPNGYAILCSHGFDIRKLDGAWNSMSITLKKDDLLCVAWKTKDSKVVNYDEG